MGAAEEIAQKDLGISLRERATQEEASRDGFAGDAAIAGALVALVVAMRPVHLRDAAQALLGVLDAEGEWYGAGAHFPIHAVDDGCCGC